MNIGQLAKNFNITLEHPSHAEEEIAEFKLNTSGGLYFSGDVIAHILVRTAPKMGLNRSDTWPWVMVNDDGRLKIVMLS